MTKKVQIRQKRKRYSIIRSRAELETIIADLPQDGEVYKLVSDGNFSSISFILFIAKRTVIREMYATTFRVGKKELRAIDAYHSEGKIGMCHFAVGRLMIEDKKADQKYGYYERLADVCDRNEWECMAINNHSKLLLFDTEKGKFVLETSSNLNENPKIEQFSLEKDAELYDFYKSVYESWRTGAQD